MMFAKNFFLNLFSLSIFFIGNICYVDDKGKSMTAFTTEGPVRTILYYGGSSAIVTITEGLICAQHQQGHDGVYQELMKVRLANHLAC